MPARIKRLLVSLVVTAILTGCVGIKVNAIASDTINENTTVAIAEAAKPVPPRLPTALLKIAYCESGNRQYLPNGKVVRGPDGHDIGRFQVRETVHTAAAKKLGYDIYTSEGNLGYALYLYKHHGTGPWYSSKNCWTSIVALKSKGYPS